MRSLDIEEETKEKLQERENRRTHDRHVAKNEKRIAPSLHKPGQVRDTKFLGIAQTYYM